MTPTMPVFGREKNLRLGEGSFQTHEDSFLWLGSRTKYSYDSQGRLVQTLGPEHDADVDGQTEEVRTATWIVYEDAIHQVIIAQGYDALDGNVTGDYLVNPVSVGVFNTGGQVTDAIQATVASGGSAWGANASDDVSLGSSPLTTLAGLGDATQSQSAYVSWTTFQYNANYQLASACAYSDVSLGQYDQTSYGYDFLGRLEWTETPNGTIIWNVLDYRGLVTSTWVGTNDSGATPTDPSNGHTSPNDMVNVADYAYNADGYGTSVTQHVDSNLADNRTTTYSYDWRDRLTSETDANNDTTSYTYDNLGDALTLTDPDQNTTTWSFDPLGQVWKETNQAGASEYFTYDADGNLASQTDYDGRLTTYNYDGLGRETTEQWWANGAAIQTLTYAYDAAGDLTSASDGSTSYTYTYDPIGRSMSATDNIAGLTPTIVLSGAYDAAGNLSSLAAAIDGTADFVNNYQYDSAGEMTQVAQGDVAGGNAVASKLVNFTYNADGQFSTIDRYLGGNEVALSTYGYDGLGRLTSLSYAQGSTALAAYAWQYDLQNEVTQETSVDGTATYSYDPTGQLTGVQYTGAQAAESYSYDANGNRSASSGYTTGTDNELLSDGTYSYTYDADGNMTSRTRISSAPADDYMTLYTWDYRDRLTSVTFENNTGAVTKAVTYTYDIFNRWLGETVTTYSSGVGTVTEIRRFVYDNNQIVLQFDSTSGGNLTAADLSHRYLWGPAVDQVLADEQVTNGDTVVWPLVDNLGTVRDLAVYNAGTGVTSVANHIVYDSFGNVVSQTNAAAVDCVFGYAGGVSDAATGEENFGRRWYDAITGRWTEPDFAGFAAGDPNLYRYCGNSPATHVDPSGLGLGNLWTWGSWKAPGEPGSPWDHPYTPPAPVPPPAPAPAPPPVPQPIVTPYGAITRPSGGSQAPSSIGDLLSCSPITPLPPPAPITIPNQPYRPTYHPPVPPMFRWPRYGNSGYPFYYVTPIPLPLDQYGEEGGWW